MSASPARRSQSSLIAAVLAGSVVVGAVSWVLFVRRERVRADAARAHAEQLESEVSRGRAYLRSRPDDQVVLAEVQAVADEIAQRIPTGRADLTIAQYLEEKAAEAGLEGFQYEFEGGIAMSEEKRGAAQPTAVERLAVAPGRLRSVGMTLTFRARYADVLSFLESVSKAPWLLEISTFDLRRSERPGQLSGRVSARYLFL